MAGLFGTGVDLIEIERIKKVADRFGDAFLKRVFTADEIARCQSTPARQWERFAVRFAAKEAVLKALGTGLSQGIRWQDVEVVREEGGRPGIRLSGAAKQVADARGVTRVHVALSHGKETAIATAHAWCDTP